MPNPTAGCDEIREWLGVYALGALEPGRTCRSELTSTTALPAGPSATTSSAWSRCSAVLFRGRPRHTVRDRHTLRGETERFRGSGGTVVADAVSAT